MTLLNCTTDQVWVSLICINFCLSYALFGNYNVGNTQFSSLLSYMFSHIELQLCTWLCFTVLQIKLECRQFAFIFVGVIPPFGTHNTGNIQFSAIFSYMLWHIELKFCIWLCCIVLQIYFECHWFALIFVGVMPLFEIIIMEIHSFPHFSPTCLHVLSWNYAYDFILLYYNIWFACRQFASLFVVVMPL